MKAWKFLLIASVILSSTGCSLIRRPVSGRSGNRVMDAYLQGLSSARSDAADYVKENLRLNEGFGYVQPYVPVVESPEVRLVWVPTHKSRHSPDVLVSGHWVYIMVKPARWFIDSQAGDRAGFPLIVPYKENEQR